MAILDSHMVRGHVDDHYFARELKVIQYKKYMLQSMEQMKPWSEDFLDWDYVIYGIVSCWFRSRVTMILRLPMTHRYN
jgi:hypothetical protein